MEQVLASRLVSITELKRSPGAVLAEAGSEPVAVLNHNRPVDDLRRAIQVGIASGPAIPADRVLAELNARYAEPTPHAKTSGKHLA